MTAPSLEIIELARSAAWIAGRTEITNILTAVLPKLHEQWAKDSGTAAMREFLRKMFVGHERGDWDGGCIQEEATKAGVLVPVVVTEPCAAEECFCSEFFDEFPITCYRLAPFILEDPAT